ncbi:unnamed protein product [Musa acuminata var. zebrina]
MKVGDGGRQAHWLLGFDGLADPRLPKNPQQRQRGTLGDGGSTFGGRTPARKACLPSPVLRLRPIVRRVDPTLFECFSSLISSAPSSSFSSSSSFSFFFSENNLSSHTSPDEPDLLNVVADLCSSAILSPPSLSLSQSLSR